MAALSPEGHRILARQHGVASLADFAAVGIAPWQVHDLVRRGGLELVLPGAWRSPSTASTELQRCAAVCRAHPEVVIAGPTAGRIHGLRRLPHDRRIHVVAPPASNPTIHPCVKPFRTATLSADDFIVRDDGIRVLDRPRTALDLARFVADDDLSSIVEQCMHDGRHDDTEMVSVAVPWISPRRRWVRRYLDALDRRIDGPAAESHLEMILGDRLRAAGLHDLVRQHVIEVPGHGIIRFDIAVPASRWAVEVDGFPTHRETNGRRADAERDAAARRVGWVTIRVGPYDFGERLGTTVRRLTASFASHRQAS